MTTSKIYKRFDSSHEFWDNFSARKEQKRKTLGCYEIKHIDNLCILTIAANPKEYFEMFEDKNINKKHKGIKKGSSELGFENFSQIIKSLNNFDTFEKPPADFKEVSRFTVRAAEMRKETVVKSKLSQVNDKRFYFLDGILSLPFHHPNLKELNEFKEKKGQKIEKYFWNEKEKLLEIEKETLKNNPRLYLYHQILTTSPKIFNINQKDNFKQEKKKLFKKTIKDVVLDGQWILR